MSKLEELLQEYCPDGVEFVKIKDYFTRLKGTPITAGKMKEIASEDGEIRIFAGGKTLINAHEEDIPNANITRVPAVLVQSRGVIDFVYYEAPFTFKNEMWAYTHNEKTTVKYLYYVLSNDVRHFRDAASGMGSMPQISTPVTEEYEIPVPPLPVQREIVRILDEYTEKVTELNASLEAELTARKKQYEYYGDKTLVGKNEGKKYFLEDVAQIIDCPHSSPKWQDSGVACVRNFNLVNGTINLGNLSYVNEEEYIIRTKRVIPKENDILFSREAPIGNVGIVPKGFKCCQGQRIVLLRSNLAIVHPKYLLYALQGNEVRNQIEKVESIGSTVSNYNLSDLRRLIITIPSYDEQLRAIDLLDVMNGYLADITEVLPAEIAARQKQYEHYRDKLLTFKRKES